MAINLLNLNLNTNVSDALAGGNIVTTTSATSEAAKALLEQIYSMLPGEILEGKLLEVDGNSAKLLLDNNLVLNTQVDSNAGLSRGQILSFEIQSNSGNQLLLRPLHVNLATDSTAVKALEAASVKVTEDTIKMVDTLMREGMPIDKDNLAMINRDINAYPNSSVEDIVLLHKFGMPVNDENLQQMNMFRNNNQYMMESIDNVAGNMADTVSKLIYDGEVDVKAFIDELKSILDAGKAGSELDEAYKLFDKLKDLDSQSAARPGIMRHIKEDLVKILSDRMLMEPGKIADKDYVKNYYADTFDIADKLERLIAENTKDNPAVLKDLANVKSNISFINDLNEIFNYVQLPLKMADGHANGDLYVYKRKKSSSDIDEDGPLTALLHLSMEALGNMDIFLKLEQGKLSTRFCLEKEEVIDFIEEHIDELNCKLIDKGYNVDTTVAALEEKDSKVINLLQGKSSDVRIISNQTFDARA